MGSILLLVIVIAGYILAYHTYGKFLAEKIFKINSKLIPPSEKFRDDVDFVPTDKHVLFGHHFTSIAGLGPIVGPAIAIIWGWVPAIIWVFFGSIFMGAVHDFGSLVISMRGEGRSIGDLSKGIINSRVRTLFLIIIFFELLIIIAVFALIIGILFNMYPAAVIPVWVEIPIAVLLGYLVYTKKMNHIPLGIAAVIVMYITIFIGTNLPLHMPALMGLEPLTIWIVLLLIYAFIASTLPVQILLQPRDYINSHQLLVAMVLLGLGVFFAHPELSAPALELSPKGAPPILPFLFIVIACGAISGFHCMVASGTSSKQCDSESSARFIGFGGMLMEGALSTFVIISIAAGLGIGLLTEDGTVLTGLEAFNHHYTDWSSASGLAAKLGAFVTGSSNMISAIGVPKNLTIAIMGVFLVSFAATTMDSATRIQRYVVSELATAWNVKLLSGKKTATLIAVITAFILAFHNGSGKGALALWPLFGAVNQLLAGLALLVITIYLARRNVNIMYTGLPMVFMILMTGWAMIINLKIYFNEKNWVLLSIGLITVLLEIWMIVESYLVLRQLNAQKGMDH